MLRITQWAKEQEFISRQFIDQTTLLSLSSILASCLYSPEQAGA